MSALSACPPYGAILCKPAAPAHRLSNSRSSRGTLPAKPPTRKHHTLGGPDREQRSFDVGSWTSSDLHEGTSSKGEDASCCDGRVLGPLSVLHPAITPDPCNSAPCVYHQLWRATCNQLHQHGVCSTETQHRQLWSCGL